MGESLLGVPPPLLERIAQVVGTPVYVYSATAVRRQWNALEVALGRVDHRIHYSVKANANLALLGLIRQLGAGVDIVSGGELARVTRAGYPPADIVFSGVGKTRHELEMAVTNGVGLVNVESDAEFEVLSAVASRLGRPARAGIRVNPDVATDTHPYTQTGQRGKKFGVPLERAEDLAVRMAADPHVQLRSVGMHVGSQIADAGNYRDGAGRLEDLVARLRSRGIETIESIDVGGGFAISQGGSKALDLSAFADAVAPVVERTGLLLLTEPGRFLVGNAGVLLTRVLQRKTTDDRTFVIVDAGMNDFIRPTLYHAHHDIDVVNAGVQPDVIAGDRVDVVGPICESGDYLALDRRMDSVGSDGLLAVRGAGAYGFSMSSSYNSRPRAAEVLVDGDRFGIIRQRESVEDLWRGETTVPIWMDD